jgi:hypothetical protein
VTLVWSVPVVAAATAALLLLARVRATEGEVTDLSHDVGRLAELRRPLAALRRASAETEAVSEAFRRNHGLGEGPQPGGGRTTPAGL